MNKLAQLSLITLISGSLASCNSGTSKEKNNQQEAQWEELFNGKDLNDWKIKIAKHELGDNFANTFRVEDGLLKVSYDGYEDFDEQYGHIFYKKPFSHYLLRVEYQFTGEQVKGGPNWALRNSGIMLHGQSPESMGKNQDFPISLEDQLLGGDGKAERSTGNLCTPGTEVLIDNSLYTEHCLNSRSKTYAGEQWVTADVLVLGDSIIKHIINKDTVLTYTKPRIAGGGVSEYDEKVKEDEKPLTGGYISLQSESHPVAFRKISIIDLSPYADDKKEMDRVLTTLRSTQ